MVSGHLGEILWRPLVYIYQPDKYQETYDATFRAISGKYYASYAVWVGGSDQAEQLLSSNFLKMSLFRFDGFIWRLLEAWLPHER